MTESVGSISVRVVPDSTGFVERLSADLVPGSSEIGAQLGRNIGTAMSEYFNAELDKMRAELDEFGTNDVSIRVRVDDDGSIAETEAKLSALNATASDSGSGFDLLSSKLLGIGVAAVSGADIAIPALLAIGAAAAGLIAGAGVFALGFSGIPAALSAAGKPATGGGGGGGSTGGSGQSAAISAQQQQLTAKEATASAAQQLTQALEDQQQAEVSLTSAQVNAKDAQTSLTQARVQAIQDMQDLNNSVTDNALAQRQAALTLAQAKETLALTLAAPGAGLPQYQDQVASAQLAYDQAKQSLSELQLQGSRLSGQQATSNAQGVNGSPGVVSAQKQLNDANQSLNSAQQNVADSATKVAQAQQNVTDTALKNSLAAQQTAVSMGAAAGGVDAFGQALQALNPLQQQFVEFLLSLKPLLDQLKDAASLFLPGLEQGIKNALPIFQPLLDIVRNTATAMGGAFENLGTAIASPGAQKFLTFLSTEIPKQIGFLSGLFIDFGQTFSGVFQAAGPLIDIVDKGFLGLFANLATASNGKGLGGFFDSLIPLAGPVEQAISAISRAIGAILQAVVPALGPALGIIAQLATGIGKLAQPVIQPLAKAFGDLLTAIEPIIPLLAGLIIQILPPLIKLLDTVITDGIAPFVSALVKALLPVLPQIGGAITQLVNALAPLLVQIITDLIPYLPTLVKLFAQNIGPVTNLAVQLLKLATDILPILLPLLKPLVTSLNDNARVATLVFNAVAKVVSWLDSLVNKVKSIAGPLTGAWNNLWGGLKTGFTNAWAGIEDTFKSIANGIIDIINAMISALDSLHYKLPSISIPGVGKIGGESFGFNIPSIPELRGYGGPVYAGQPYTVGDKGVPEIFVPQVNGQIVDGVNSQKYMSNRAATNFNIIGTIHPEAVAQQAITKLAAAGV